MKRSRTQVAENGRVATAPIDDSPVQGALLTLRLITAGEPGAVWHERTPAGSLVFDLLTASGGVLVETRGHLLLARFAGVHPACLAARRLQWAMQGLADNPSAAKVALTALVQAGEDSTPGNQDDAFSELEKAPAGRILVAERAAKILEQEPGFATRKGGQNTLELLWRAPDQHTTRAADELTLARLSGEIHGAPVSAPAGQPVHQDVRHEATRVVPALGRETDHAGPDEQAPRSTRLRWVLAVAAAVVLAAGGFYLFNQGPKQSKAQATPGASTAGPSQPASASATSVPGNLKSTSQAPAQNANPDHPQVPAQNVIANQPDTSAAASQKLSRREKAKPPAQEAGIPAAVENTKPQPAPASEEAKIVPGGDCQYQSDQIAGLLARAESSRAHGQYEDAKRKFMSVLACDRGNSKAQAGLQQVLQAIKAEGSDDQ